MRTILRYRLRLIRSSPEAHLAVAADVEVVAYCRGPYCALAPQGVVLLRKSVRRARRLEHGFPEWRLAGLPVATGSRPA